MKIEKEDVRMNYQKLFSYYSFIIGISMIAMWTVFILTGQVPELMTEPARIIMHLAAEFSTAISLLIGGYGLIRSKSWGKQFHQFSLGMLMYTLIVSPGYYLNLGEFAMVGMFAVMLILTLIVLIITYIGSKNIL